jgi:hypothetical protein
LWNNILRRDVKIPPAGSLKITTTPCKLIIYKAFFMGKLVHNNLYPVKGEIAARKLVKQGQTFIIKNLTDIYLQAWNIVSKVRANVDPWIETTAIWSTVTLPEILGE